MTTIEALSARRRKYIEAARDNGFEEGLRTLLADLYPDNAHFIYELLQNAEDAGAREVTFDLRADGLRVEHDGARLFDLGDIESITGIGQSTKKDDATRIGKFGVGFKAVFAYTQTPVIHSGEHSFAIHDLFVPLPVPPAVKAGRTVFWFPFDRADKPADRAVEEVATALREISGTTLLFLNNIALIACSLSDGDERLLERRALGDQVVEIHSVHEEEKETGSSYWYRITGDVVIDGTSYPTAAAFALEPYASRQSDPRKLKEPRKYAVRPVDGQVFIYFPAVRETSGLKFHIHAPFGSTVARDSVRDDPGNDALVAGIADLIAAELPRMREAGLINEGLLSALPNNSDDLPKRYSPVRDKIITAFSVEPLAPMLGGGHAPGRQLLRSDRAIRAALSIGDANFLRGLVGDKMGTGWLPEREGRPGAFLNSIESLSFAKDELSTLLERLGEIHLDFSLFGDDSDLVDEEDRADLNAWHTWISARADDWVRGFYMMLEALAPKSKTHRYSEDPAGEDFLSNLTGAPLLRVQEGESVRHVPGPRAHLPTVVGLRHDGLVVDALAALEGETDSDALELLRSFYRHAGVKRWDAAAQLDARFSNYGGQEALITEQHLEDLKALAKLLEDKAVSPSTFSVRPILVALRKDGTRYWAKPSSAFLDAPFASTGLASLFESDEYPDAPPGRLDAHYLNAFPGIAALAEALGVIHGLRIAPAFVKNNPQFMWEWVDRENHNKVLVDWQIPHFDLIASFGDETLLRELWKLVAAAPHTYVDAVYRSNGSSRRNLMKSQLFQKITSVPWILDCDGNLRLPANIAATELAEHFPAPVSLGLLVIANFGRKAAADAQDQRRQHEVAKSLGFDSIDEMQRIADLHRRNPEKFKTFIEDMEAEVRLPDGPSAAPAHRAKLAAEQASGAPMRKYDNRMRSVYVQVPGHLSAARGSLRQHYTNDDGTMVCQICASSMPFKVSGDYYFEAVQFVKDTTRDLRENRLALCPTCAAKYRHARGTSLEDLRDDLLTAGVGHQGSITVDVILAGDAAKIRFVGKHAIDLQAALSAMGSGPVADDEFNGLVLPDDYEAS